MTTIMAFCGHAAGRSLAMCSLGVVANYPRVREADLRTLDIQTSLWGKGQDYLMMNISPRKDCHYMALLKNFLDFSEVLLPMKR